MLNIPLHGQNMVITGDKRPQTTANTVAASAAHAHGKLLAWVATDCAARARSFGNQINRTATKSHCPAITHTELPMYLCRLSQLSSRGHAARPKIPANMVLRKMDKF